MNVPVDWRVKWRLLLALARSRVVKFGLRGNRRVVDLACPRFLYKVEVRPVLGVPTYTREELRGMLAVVRHHEEAMNWKVPKPLQGAWDE